MSKYFHVHLNLSSFKVSTVICFAELQRIKLSCVNYWRTKRLVYSLSILLISYCTIWKYFNSTMISNLYLLGGRLMSRRLLRRDVSQRKTFEKIKKRKFAICFHNTSSHLPIFQRSAIVHYHLAFGSSCLRTPTIFFLSNSVINFVLILVRNLFIKFIRC